MVRILRNVGGVPGLHLALDCLDENQERQYFDSRVLHGQRTAAQSALETHRHGLPTGPNTWDESVWKMSNLIGDTFPEHHVPFDYCFAISYPGGSKFQSHYDSRHRWGETVAGVSLGQSAVIQFIHQPDKDKKTGLIQNQWPLPPAHTLDPLVRTKYTKTGRACVEVTLPRRSIYVMTGDARLRWKHGILPQSKARLAALPPAASWNPWNVRRSLTFRCTKYYSDAYLQHQLRCKPHDVDLYQRWQAQRRFQADNEEGPEHGQRMLQFVLNSPFRDSRFGSPAAAAPTPSIAGIPYEARGFANATHSDGAGYRFGGGSAASANVTMSEEEQLQAALRASLQDRGGSRATAMAVRKSRKSPASPNVTLGYSAEPILLDVDDEDSKPAAKSTKLTSTSPRTTRNKKRKSASGSKTVQQEKHKALKAESTNDQISVVTNQQTLDESCSDDALRVNERRGGMTPDKLDKSRQAKNMRAARLQRLDPTYRAI